MVSLSKVKYPVYCEMCECTYNVIQWKNRVRTRTFGIRFCLVHYGVWFGSVWVLTHFLLSGSRSVRLLAKPWFWFGLFLLVLCSFSSVTTTSNLMLKLYGAVISARHLVTTALRPALSYVTGVCSLVIICSSVHLLIQLVLKYVAYFKAQYNYIVFILHNTVWVCSGRSLQLSEIHQLMVHKQCQNYNFCSVYKNKLAECVYLTYIYCRTQTVA